jgi:polyvinyl alcohol dehydrogenase (cytochrome)
MAPATAIAGVVFSGSLDGHLRAYATKDGKLIWDFDTLRDFDTVNGVKAHGGSLNATGPIIANGMMFVNSGYSQLTGIGGNVLLAFGK